MGQDHLQWYIDSFFVEHISKVMMICAEVWPEKGTMTSGQDVFYSFELKPQLLEQPIQFLGVWPLYVNSPFVHHFLSIQSIYSPCFSSIGCPYYPYLIISIRSPWISHEISIFSMVKSWLYTSNFWAIESPMISLNSLFFTVHIWSGPGWGSRRPRKVPPRMPQTAARNAKGANFTRCHEMGDWQP